MPSQPSANSTTKQITLDDFQHRFYASKVWKHRTFWRGVPLLKNPMDLWLYQQLIYQVKPQVIVELGTFCGGSAYYLADMLELIHGHDSNAVVVTVDIQAPESPPQHDRIHYLTGSTVDAGIVKKVKAICKANPGPVMVLADSDHTAKHVREELEQYHDLVTLGSYFIVEDTVTEYPDGPMDAVNDFLPTHTNFRADLECHQYILSFNYCGFLQRIS